MVCYCMFHNPNATGHLHSYLLLADKKETKQLIDLRQCEKCVMEQRIRISVFKSFDF